MAIPAICKACGLVFPSGIDGLGRIKVVDSTSSCPRCGQLAPILDGFFDLQDGLIRLVEGPDFTRSVLMAMERAVSDLARQKTTQNLAVESVSKVNSDAGALFREWLGLGIAFAGLMVATAALVLDLKDRNGNQEPNRYATEVFEELMRATPQPDLRFRPPHVTNGWSVDRSHQSISSDHPRTSNTNRKQVKKERVGYGNKKTKKGSGRGGTSPLGRT